MRILVVEDDQIIREGISEYLSEFGYDIVQAKDGQEALLNFDRYEINLVILDIQIPFLNGLEVLKEIRKKSELPVLMLTAFNDEEYKINAFSSLADGYMEKPFSLPVLKVRIDSLIKRHFGNHKKFEYNNAEVDFTSYSAKFNGEDVDINAKELEILKYLLENEEIQSGYKLIRDSIIFTNIRIIFTDKQGATGRKMSIKSIFLMNIVNVEMETAGAGIDDSEITITYLENIFLKAHNEHFSVHKFEFPKKTDIVPLYTYLLELAYHNRLKINDLDLWYKKILSLR